MDHRRTGRAPALPAPPLPAPPLPAPPLPFSALGASFGGRRFSRGSRPRPLRSAATSAGCDATVRCATDGATKAHKRAAAAGRRAQGWDWAAGMAEAKLHEIAQSMTLNEARSPSHPSRMANRRQ